MIHVLTLNPTLDLTYLVDEFRHDGTTRAHTVLRAPGGKGINLARVATRIGHPSVALGFMGGHTGLEVVEMLEREGVRCWFTQVDGPTRTNPIVQDRDGRQMRLSSSGPPADERAVRALWDALFLLRPPDFLVVSGSRPRGVPDDFYPRAIERARGLGIRCALDADGAELTAGVEAGAHLIKPNRHELERLAGRPLPDLSSVILACHEALDRGVSAVCASLGREGALLVTPAGTWRAVGTQVEVRSSVGAGDSLLAGLCARLAEGVEPMEALRFAVACGTAAAMMPGPLLCDLPGIESVLPGVSAERVV